MPWLEMDHMTDLSEEMLMDALAKAEQEVLQRRKMEYEVWNKCKFGKEAINSELIIFFLNL